MRAIIRIITEGIHNRDFNSYIMNAALRICDIRNEYSTQDISHWTEAEFPKWTFDTGHLEKNVYAILVDKIEEILKKSNLRYTLTIVEE